jgi:hypothetical protein
MQVKNDNGNLVYDSENSDCSIEICHSQGEYFAFVKALDIGVALARLVKPNPVRYWGKFNPENEEDSIRHILHYGGKWPSLKH